MADQSGIVITVAGEASIGLVEVRRGAPVALGGGLDSIASCLLVFPIYSIGAVILLKC